MQAESADFACMPGVLHLGMPWESQPGMVVGGQGERQGHSRTRGRLYVTRRQGHAFSDLYLCQGWDTGFGGMPCCGWVAIQVIRYRH